MCVVRTHTSHLATPAPDTLSLHDALPIFGIGEEERDPEPRAVDVRATDDGRDEPSVPRIGGIGEPARRGERGRRDLGPARSEEHTSELQSLRHLVCRLLLEKKNKTPKNRV